MIVNKLDTMVSAKTVFSSPCVLPWNNSKSDISDSIWQCLAAKNLRQVSCP